MTKLKLSGSWPQWMDAGEARICNRLITAILGHGYLVRVREEEGDVMCDTTSNRMAIQKGTAQRGMTFYDVMDSTMFKPGQELKAQRHIRIGTFILIHGNGEDVISDYIWHPQVPEAEQLMAKIDNFVQED